MLYIKYLFFIHLPYTNFLSIPTTLKKMIHSVNKKIKFLLRKREYK